MSDDATLDAFADAADAADPTPSTSAWTPGGACANCDATPGRRWRADGELVCADCATWRTGDGACDQ